MGCVAQIFSSPASLLEEWGTELTNVIAIRGNLCRNTITRPGQSTINYHSPVTGIGSRVRSEARPGQSTVNYDSPVTGTGFGGVQSEARPGQSTVNYHSPVTGIGSGVRSEGTTLTISAPDQDNPPSTTTARLPEPAARSEVKPDQDNPPSTTTARLPESAAGSEVKPDKDNPPSTSTARLNSQTGALTGSEAKVLFVAVIGAILC
ncbi:unnamed protein product [Heligmosomoides polygyrus]|uniref:Uncharacterized protein n=1 Tax=Heligmosomoides polygyrus TaxID=6339 RepID=A0A3P7ZLF4_HELPZ|nr:unnamed protein product [Heligmosomoides polygyrus]